MALRGMWGFDKHGTFKSEYQGDWLRYGTRNGDSQNTYTPVTGRSGSGLALRAFANYGGTATDLSLRSHALTMVGDTVIFQMGYRRLGAPSSQWSLVRFLNAGLSEVFRIDITPAGALQVIANATLGTTPFAYTESAWFHFAVKLLMLGAGGSAQVRINDDPALGFSVANVDAINAAGPIVYFDLQNRQDGSGQTQDYDDIVIMDGSGSNFNDFIGDAEVPYQQLAGDAGPNQMALTGGVGGVHATALDEIGLNTADFVLGATTGQQEAYTVADLAAAFTAATGIGLKFTARASKDAPGGRFLKLGGRQGAGAPTMSAAMGLSTTEQWYNFFQETNPQTGLPWTAAEFAQLVAWLEAA